MNSLVIHPRSLSGVNLTFTTPIVFLFRWYGALHLTPSIIEVVEKKVHVFMCVFGELVGSVFFAVDFKIYFVVIVPSNWPRLL